jgi:hypothetical protein
MTTGAAGDRTDRHAVDATAHADLLAGYAPVTVISNAAIFLPAYVLALTQGSGQFSSTGGGNRFGAWLLDASSQEQISGWFILPTGWATFHVDLYWSNFAAGSGNVVWQPTYSVVADTVSLSAGDVTGTKTTVAAPAQDVLKVTRIMTSITAAVGVWHIRLPRVAADGGDTLANDAEVIGLLVSKAS